MPELVNFLKNEDGAVTVDWVVLTAAIVGLGLAVVVSISGGATSVSSGLGSNLSNSVVAEVDFSNVNG